MSLTFTYKDGFGYCVLFNKSGGGSEMVLSHGSNYYEMLEKFNDKDLCFLKQYRGQIKPPIGHLIDLRTGESIFPNGIERLDYSENSDIMYVKVPFSNTFYKFRASLRFKELVDNYEIRGDYKTIDTISNGRIVKTDEPVKKPELLKIEEDEEEPNPIVKNKPTPVVKVEIKNYRIKNIKTVFNPIPGFPFLIEINQHNNYSLLFDNGTLRHPLVYRLPRMPEVLRIFPQHGLTIFRTFKTKGRPQLIAIDMKDGRIVLKRPCSEIFNTPGDPIFYGKRVPFNGMEANFPAEYNALTRTFTPAPSTRRIDTEYKPEKSAIKYSCNDAGAIPGQSDLTKVGLVSSVSFVEKHLIGQMFQNIL